MIVEMETISLVECVSTRTWGQVSLHKIYISGFEIYLEVRWKAYSKKVQTHWKTDIKLSGYWWNKHLIELHKLQEQDCKSFLRTKLPTATASSQLRTPDLATTTRTWLKDNKETGMCPAALAAWRDGFARGRDPRRLPGDDLVHLPVSSKVEDRKWRIQERSRNTFTDGEHCSVRLLRCNCGSAGLGGAASHHRARMTQISGGPRAEHSPGSLLDWDNKGWSHSRQPLWCSDLSIPFKISITRYIKNEYVTIW